MCSIKFELKFKSFKLVKKENGEAFSSKYLSLFREISRISSLARLEKESYSIEEIKLFSKFNSYKLFISLKSELNNFCKLFESNFNSFNLHSALMSNLSKQRLSKHK